MQQQSELARIAHVLEDPKAEQVARVYAEALLKVVPKAEAEGQIEELTSFVDDVLRKNPEFANILLSGMVHRDDKLALLDRTITPRATPVIANFLKVLAKHDRLELLPLIATEAQRLHELEMGKQSVLVTSAQPLSPSTLERIRTELASRLPFQPILVQKVDPSLLGGLVIRVGDTVYDTSLRTRLKQLSTRLRQRSLNEIQSGRNRFSS